MMTAKQPELPEQEQQLKGGALRNIPVGGGSRKNIKRSVSSSSSSSPSSSLKNINLSVSDQKPDHRSSDPKSEKE
ncbi:unnamed protein product [Microthlaspi erraticum]|uniref:Uncharacterized protein n=1 Tax=Microthlaspi erraticum TaxID=1685480 RepID=A0A6D2L9Q2_9BRAS|nr:unnamed protein product [Microthlaspi erraticum]